MKVLLAVDGSPQSLDAAKVLANLPFAVQPQYTVVTALIDEPNALSNTAAGVQDAENEAAVRNIEAISKLLDAKASQVHSVVRREHPSQLILDVAREIDADLIVVGSVGHSAIYRMTIGSTADHVANHARCSTLVVRIPEGSRLAATAPAKVFIAHDGSETAAVACEQLHRFHWSNATHIQAIRLLPRPKLIAEDEAYDPVAIRETESSLLELKGSSPCSFKAVVKEVEDIPSGLYGMVQAEQPDLLFVGDSGRSALSRFFLGSTSRYLLHHVSCPIWIARKKTW